MRVDREVFELLETTAPPADGWHVCEIYEVDSAACRHDPERGESVRVFFEVVGDRDADDGAIFNASYTTRSKIERQRETACRAMARLLRAAMGSRQFPKSYDELIGKRLSVKTRVIEKQCSDGQVRSVLVIDDMALAPN